MRVLAVYSIKGGVGKTASAVNLAYLSSLEGSRTVLWDLDPQGAASFTFRIRPAVAHGSRGLFKSRRAVLESLKGTDFDGLHLLPSDFSYRHLDLLLDGSRKRRRLRRILKPLRAEYDDLFIDCAPGISTVSEQVFDESDVLLVPIIPTVLSLRTLGRLMKHLRGMAGPGPRVMPFFSLVDRRKSMHRQVCDWALEKVPWILRQEIPYATLVEQMGVQRAPLEAFAPKCPAAEAYRKLWDEIQTRLAEAPRERPAKRTIRSLLERTEPHGGRRSS